MDITELTELIRLHGTAVYGFCRRLCPSREDADDLYQETFLKAVELCWRMDPSQNPKSYLLSIAVRLYSNNRRKVARRMRIAPVIRLSDDFNEISGPGLRETPEHILLARERRASIQAAANDLHDKLKIPLYMHYTADMSVDEIAAALEIPAGTVKSRLHKARAALKNKLEDDLA